MIEKVVKRDSTVTESFDFNKVKNAINHALTANGYEARKSFPFLEMRLKLMHGIKSVEEIQDLVEKYLLSRFPLDVARSYILYREDHKNTRFISERIDYMKHYMLESKNASSSSETDPNANLAVKNVANLTSEIYKTKSRMIQRYNMKKKLQELYPEVANQYRKDIESHVIYIHDETYPVPTNYCEAVSLYPLIQHGTGQMDGLKSGPPTNLSSFCGQFVNLMFMLASQTRGACAFGEFFNFLDYFCAKDFGEDYHKNPKKVVMLTPRRTIRDMLHQYYQQIVYAMNQPMGSRAYSSPFINVSYYDSNYWHSLFDDFCFPDGSKPVWARVSFLQKDFMQWFNEERTKTLLTFPVSLIGGL